MKKHTAIILAIFMLFNIFGAVCVQASENPVSFETEIAVVNGLGLAEKSNISVSTSDDAITRAEFAGMAAALNREIFSDLEPSFLDVPKDSVFADEIYTLRDLGEMIGYSEIEFGMELNISFEEAATVLLRILGYDPLIKYGSMTMPAAIQSANLKDRVKISNNAAITKGEAAALIYNALFAPVCVKAFSTDTQYYIDNNRNILYDNLGISAVTGVITQVYNTSITVASRNDVPEHGFALGGQVFSCENYTEAENYLGYRVECYYRAEKNGEYDSVFVHPKNTNVCTVNSEDFESGDLKAVRYYTRETNYYTTERLKRLNLSSTLDVVYNCVACTDFNAEDLMLAKKSGYTVFIDNNNDGTYDVALVYECRDYVVSYVDADNLRIYTKWQDTIDLSGADNLYIEDVTGRKIEFGALMSSDIVTLMMSKDGKTVRIIRCNNSISTKIKQIDRDNHKVTLDNDKEYYVDDSLWERIDDIDYNSYGYFFLDFRGRLAGVMFENLGFNENYAYLVSARYIGSLSDNTVTVKLFRLSGEMEEYPLSKKITLDGESVEAPQFYKSVLMTDENGNEYINRQLIIFKTNEVTGGINFIDTANLGPSEGENSLEVKGYRNVTGLESYGDGYLSKYFAVAPYATRLFIPTPNAGDSPSIVNSYDDSDYSIRRVADTYTDKNIDAAMLDDAGIASVVIYYYKKGIGVNNYGGDIDYSEYQHRPSVMVDSVTQTLDGDDIVYTLTYYERNVKKTAFAVDEKILKKQEYAEDGTPTGKYKDIAQGDIVRFALRNNGRIDALSVDFDAERKDNGILNYSDFSQSYIVECGAAYSAGPNSLSLLPAALNSKDIYTPAGLSLGKKVTRMYSSSAPITVFDRKTKTVSDGKYTDIVGYKQNPREPSIIVGRCSDAGYSYIFVIK